MEGKSVVAELWLGGRVHTYESREGESETGRSRQITHTDTHTHTKNNNNNSRMACWGDEVETEVDAGIVEGDQLSLDLQLLLEVGLELLVDVLQDGLAAVLLVDLVSIASRAHHGQPQPHVALPQICMHIKTTA